MNAMGEIVVPNCNFEDGLNGWSFPYGRDGIALASAPGTEGGRCLRMEGEGREERRAESGNVPARSGRTYAAFVRGDVEKGEALLSIRFKDGAMREIAAASARSAVSGGWAVLKVMAEAPAGTEFMTVSLGTGSPAQNAVRFADVGITDRYASLGAQVTNATLHAATLGKDASGRDVVYAVMDGASGYNARLAAIDPNREEACGSWELPGAGGGWAAATAGDGSIYVGTYAGGLVYRYVPGEAEVKVLGRPGPDESFVYGLTAGSGNEVYGGTYPGAEFFKYAPDEGFVRLGPAPVEPDERYVRDVAFDRGRGVFYLGIGSHAHLKKYEMRTGELTEMLPDEYAGEQFVYDVDFAEDRLFARLSPSCKTLVFRPDDPQPEHVIEGVHSLGVSPGRAGCVYYTSGGVLHRYDIAAKRAVSLGVDTTIAPVGFFFVRLEDQTNFPGETLIGIGSKHGRTRLFKFNLETGKLSIADIALPEVPTNIVSVVCGPDGRIWSSGFLVGGHAVYKPMRDASVQVKGVMQCENMAVLNGKLYFGVYPGARIFEYDPSEPWTIDRGGDNPRLLFELKAEEQDRPFGMTGGDGLLFVGTVSGYGKLGGALTVYDPSSGTYEIFRHVVPNQSIVALAYANRTVYAGSSVWGGIGVEPAESEAKLLVFDVPGRRPAVVSLPVPGLKAVTALTVGPDGNIWGMAEGYLFVYDPAAGDFIYFEEKFPEVRYGSHFVWRDAELLAASDGNVYGTIKGKYLFRIDPSTKRVTILADDGAKFLAQDAYGNLYFAHETVLKRYVP